MMHPDDELSDADRLDWRWQTGFMFTPDPQPDEPGDDPAPADDDEPADDDKPAA